MTLEQAKEKLERMQSRKDPLLSAFYGGRVGFRKPTKKYKQEIERSLIEAREISKLIDFIAKEEQKELVENNPQPSRYYSSVDEIQVGNKYYDSQYGLVIVKRINKNTVTIQTASGYTERRSPHFIYR